MWTTRTRRLPASRHRGSNEYALYYRCVYPAVRPRRQLPGRLPLRGHARAGGGPWRPWHWDATGRHRLAGWRPNTAGVWSLPVDGFPRHGHADDTGANHPPDDVPGNGGVVFRLRTKPAIGIPHGPFHDSCDWPAEQRHRIHRQPEYVQPAFGYAADHRRGTVRERFRQPDCTGGPNLPGRRVRDSGPIRRSLLGVRAIAGGDGYAHISDSRNAGRLHRVCLRVGRHEHQPDSHWDHAIVYGEYRYDGGDDCVRTAIRVRQRRQYEIGATGDCLWRGAGR